MVDRPPFRADHVGSYLRPARLATAREAFFAGKLPAEELRSVEDDCILEVVRAHPGVRNVHDLRTRAAGVHAFIQFHIELDPKMSLMRAHEVSDEVEHRLCAAFPHAEVIIHQDPLGVEAPQPSMVA